MKIANIVTKSRNHGFGDEFNVVDDCSGITKGIPTLIIGIENARACIEGFNVLQKSYDDGMVWWTYKKTERRSDYEDDVDRFVRFASEVVKNSVRYEYVDFTGYSLERLKKLVMYMRSSDRKKVMLSKNGLFMFVYSERYGVVFGISLSLCSYVGVSPEKVVSRMKSNRYNRFVYGAKRIDSRVASALSNDRHCLLVFL